MEGDQFLQQRECLIGNCDQIENVPVHDGETMADIVKEVQNQVVSNSCDTQVTEEMCIKTEDELKGVQLTKCREYDGLSFSHRLRFEAEILAKAKAMEEVTVCTLQSHMQELQENQEQLRKEILNLQTFEEKVQRELTIEQFNRSQIEKQMNNTGKIVEMLKQNYGGLEKTYQATLEDANNLEEDVNEEIQKYETVKQEKQRAIEIENENLKEVRNVFEIEHGQYNNELNRINGTLKELTEAEIEITNKIASLKEKCDNMKNQFLENDKMLSKNLSENEVLCNSINSINLDELEAEQTEKGHNYWKSLNAIEADLNQAKESCIIAEEKNAALLKFLENEVKITNELEASNDMLENEQIALITAQKELNDIGKVIETKANHLLSLESELQVADNTLPKLNEEISHTTGNKKAIIEKLHVKQQENQEAQAKLANLQYNADKLAQENESDALKLVELRQRESSIKTEIQNVSSELLDAKAKYLDTEKTYSDQLEKINEEQTCAQKTMEQVRQEKESQTKTLKGDLSAYKAQSEQANKENQDRNKQELQDLEEKLNKVKCDLKVGQEHTDQLRVTVNQKKVARNKLQLKLQLLKFDSQEFLQNREVVAENVMPQGILKSPGKPLTSKKVSWQVPSNSSIASDIGQQQNVWKSQDELFNQLLRMSPPQRLDESKSKKRARFD